MAERPYTHGDPSLRANERPEHADMPFAGVEEVAGMEAARLDFRQVGYCALCDKMVERCDDNSCPAGHPEEAVFGRIILEAEEPVPQLPRFNWGAFLVPFLWGPGHGQWVGAFFLPIWLFMDNIVRAAVVGGPTGMKIAAALVVVATVAFEAHFAKTANGMAWRRVADKTTVDDFLRRERTWTIAMVPLFILFVSWAVYFDVVLR